MKIKTSVTLSEGLLDVVNRRAKRYKKSRSDFLEAAAWAFIGQLKGLKHEGSIHRDELDSLPKSLLCNFIGTLSSQKVRFLNQALRVALEIPDR